MDFGLLSHVYRYDISHYQKSSLHYVNIFFSSILGKMVFCKVFILLKRISFVDYECT